MKMMGHKDIRMTERYVNSDDEMLSNAMKVVKFTYLWKITIIQEKLNQKLIKRKILELARTKRIEAESQKFRKLKKHYGYGFIES